MKKTILKLFSTLLILSMIILSCEDQNENEPLTKDGSVPDPVSNISIVDLAGKSEISYSLPDDKNLLYIKAVYKLDNGTVSEVKASYYKKSLVVDGFATAGAKEVQLIAVSRSEVESEPVTVIINPSESPIYDVFRSLNVGPDFGGLFIEAENPIRKELAILVMEKDDNGDWVDTGNTIYTKTDEIFRTVRGLDTIPYDFAFTVRDRFLNTTDTLFQTIKPIFETEIPASSYSGFPLPGDAPTNDFRFPIERMFDGNFINWPRVFITDASAPAPHSFTIDIGQELKISRVKIWDYPQGTANGFIYYWQFNMRKFEIWGSNNPNSDGTYASWDLLGEYEVVKPSGLPITQQSPEDFEFANAGFDWPIPITAPKYRYIRIKNLENWSGSGRLAIAELRVYGDPR
ncbi:DUF5000 domain-containing lipoprotein [Polaribacter sp. Hel_I_88]|uniref:DUF5000 domain-containing lipoprotein n=1 Tax=Polaribacter sp. Hel_I_88 TaxID=1250006 RepID=UPI00047C261C|nr:DUF5000 domain-containing lipoprotein [Polaribacter sp. Hel_I_88]